MDPKNSITSLYSSVAFCALLLITGCYPLSNLQSASLIPEKTADISTSYSVDSYHNRIESEGEICSRQIGINVDYGIHPNINGRVRYSLLIPTYTYAQLTHYISLGLKVPIVKKHLAFYLPVSFYLAKELRQYNNTFIEPTVLGSVHFQDRVSLNLSLSLKLFFEDINNVITSSLGVDIHKCIPNTIIRPEWGIVADPHLNGFYHSFILGVTYQIRPKE